MPEGEYDLLRLENQLCFPLYVCAKEVVGKYRPLLDALGITYTQYIAMMVLWERRSVRAKELGEMLFLDSGTLTPMLKKMEAKGYVTRSRDPGDERSLIVAATDEGMALREKAKEVPYRVGSCIPLSPEDALALQGILGRMMASFRAERSPSPMLLPVS